MDIFKRNCRKKDVQLPVTARTKREVVIVPPAVVPEEEPAAEEEEESLNDDFDLDGLCKELDCMKRRIQRIQLHLKLSAREEECPEEECMDFEVLLNCSANTEICELQKNEYRMQCQINELIRGMQFAKEQIRDLRIRVCEKTREIEALQKEVNRLNSWRLTLHHEFGVCVERFEYLKHVKVEWKDIDAKLNAHKVQCNEFEKKFMTKSCFQEQRKNFLGEICYLKKLFKEFFQVQMQRFSVLTESLLNIANAQDVKLKEEHIKLLQQKDI